ncbi:MAG: CHAD domain-containing protein [Pseudomonadota bacterium]
METELKLHLTDPARWNAILRTPALLELAGGQPPRQEHLEARYFDTADGALRQARLAYRIRREGARWVATIKADGSSFGGLHQRPEWNVAVAEPTPDLAPFLATPIGPTLREAVSDAPLVELFRTRFERTMLDLHTPTGDAIEFAADRGEILAGEAREAILELELELKAGEPGALLRLGARLARDFPLLPEPRSKFHRALLLAGLDARPARFAADDFEPDPAAPAGTVLSHLLIHEIHRLLDRQAAFLDAPDDAESLHQLRVQLRRLRALLAFAKPLLGSGYDEHQDALRQWGRSLASVREIDVLISAWQALRADALFPLPGQDALGALLGKQRRHALALVREAVGHGQSTPVLLELWAWLLTTPLHGETPLAEFSTARLRQWLKGLRKAGSTTDWHDPTALHRLRIRGKKLRYVLQALMPVLPAGSDRLVRRLLKLQKQLGQLHDAALTPAQLDALLPPRATAQLQREAGLLAGWQYHAALEARRKLLKQWKRMRRE